DRIGGQLIERGSLLYGGAGLVHIGLRLEREDLFASDTALADQPPEPLSPGRETILDGDRIDCHEADIVPVPGHSRLRIAAADPEQHGWCAVSLSVRALPVRRRLQEPRLLLVSECLVLTRPCRPRPLSAWWLAPRSRRRSYARWRRGCSRSP